MLFFLSVPFPASRSKKAHKPKPKKKAVATSGPRSGSMSHTFQGFATGTSHDRPQLCVFIIFYYYIIVIVIIIIILLLLYYYIIIIIIILLLLFITVLNVMHMEALAA